MQKIDTSPVKNSNNSIGIIINLHDFVPIIAILHDFVPIYFPNLFVRVAKTSKKFQICWNLLKGVKICWKVSKFVERYQNLLKGIKKIVCVKICSKMSLFVQRYQNLFKNFNFFFKDVKICSKMSIFFSKMSKFVEVGHAMP